MDNLCHTLAGAACARAGLTRPARFAAVTSMLAANLPDVDVLVFATDIPSVAFRRGWTHGILAQAVLPALLAAVMLVVARSSRQAHDPPPALAPLLVLSYLGVLSHVFMDLLNNYGVRLLMPFSGRWFYGDALFIVDPWLWILLGAGVVLGTRGRLRRTRAADPRGSRLCLVAAIVYILAMVGSARAARAVVAGEWQDARGAKPAALMVGPVLLDPFRKTVIVDAGDDYQRGEFTWLSRQTVFSPPVKKNAGHPATAAARHDPRVAGLLVWSRFPFWEIETVPAGTRVTVRDMRFAAFRGGGFTATTVVR